MPVLILLSSLRCIRCDSLRNYERPLQLNRKRTLEADCVLTVKPCEQLSCDQQSCEDRIGLADPPDWVGSLKAERVRRLGTDRRRTGALAVLKRSV